MKNPYESFAQVYRPFVPCYWISIFTIVVDAGLPKHGYFVHHGDQYVRFRVNFPV